MTRLKPYGYLMTVMMLVLLARQGTALAFDDRTLDAVRQVASADPVCKAIQPFYWEVGDASGVKASGSEGRNAPTAQTDMPIASATKWLFGAYVAQVRNGQFTPQDIQALTMHTGYVGYQHRLCVKVRDRKQAALTVAECFAESAPLAGRNDALSPEEMGKFHYAGGHFQFWAVQNGLGDLNNAGLAQAFNRVLGTGLEIGFESPQLAGGARMSGAHYGQFLQRLLRNELVLGEVLGQHAVCTVKADCPAAAVQSPLPENLHWHYSLGHWVEDGSADSDGTFSSAGAFGFYPWITADRQTYGVIARVKKSLLERPAPDSVLCGQRLRLALQSAL